MIPDAHYIAWHDRVDRERRTHLSLFPEPNKWAQFSPEQIQGIAERLSGRTLWLPKEELIRRIEERERLKRCGA